MIYDATQSLSAAYKDSISYLKDKVKYVEYLEGNLTKLGAEIATLYNRKKEIDRVLEAEENTEYSMLQKQIKVFQEKYNKFICKHRKDCASLPNLTAEPKTSNVIDAPRTTILTRNFFRLVKLGKDINELYAFICWVNDRMRLKNLIPALKKVGPVHVKHDYIDLPSFTGYVNKMARYLTEAENRSIGITGPIGVGKTTFMNKLFDQLQHTSSPLLSRGIKFDVVIWISYDEEIQNRQDESVEMMQGSIMEWLKLRRETNNIKINADVISRALWNKKYILLIDQVTSSIDLDQVGIQKDHEFGKVVVASSSNKVIRQMTDQQVKIRPQSKDAALHIFQKVCGKIYDPLIKNIAEDIVELCGGLPLVIKLVATYLKGEKEERVWREVNWILQSESNLASLLKLGGVDRAYKSVFENLEDSHMECILYVTLFPWNHEIDKDYLVECWKAEGFLHLDTSELGRARDQGAIVLKELIDHYLLENCSDNCVKMPLYFRRVALELAAEHISERSYINCVPEIDKFLSAETWGKSRRLLLISNVVPDDPRGILYYLSTLLLHCNVQLVALEESLVDLMYHLKILDLSETGIELLPHSIGELRNLVNLYLKNCSQLAELPPQVTYLVNLEVLDVRGTSIHVLPMEIGKMFQLRCLRISVAQNKCNRNREGEQMEMMVPPGIIVHLKNLEELTIEAGCCSQGWNRVADQIANEIASLEKLTTLTFHFPTVNSLKEFVTVSKSWRSTEIYEDKDTFRSFKFTIGCHEMRLPYGSDISGISAKRHLRFNTNEEISSVREVVSLASSFELAGHLGVKSLNEFDSMIKEALRVCVVECCGNLTSVVDASKIKSMGKTTSIVLPCLEKLYLFDLQLLQSFWKGAVLPGSLANLKVLTLFGCPELTEILNSELAKALSSLRHIKVEDCAKVVDIVSADDAKNISEDVDLSDILHKVKTVELVNLPELESICRSTSVVWKSLKKIVTISCNKLAYLGLTWSNVENLETIKCESSWWTALPLSEDEKLHFLPRCDFIAVEHPFDPLCEITEEGTVMEDIQKQTGLLRRHEKMAAQTDILHFVRENEPALGVVIPVMSNIMDLKLMFFSSTSSPLQQQLRLNNYFGLDPKTDSYIFSANDASLPPKYLIVNKSEGIPTADEWNQSGVVNLAETSPLLLDAKPDCPNLVLLFLQRNNRLTHIPPSFFDCMPALSFLDLSNTRIRDLPNSLFKLTKLQVLMIRSCISLGSLPSGVKHLKNIEVLDLLGTDLYCLPEEVGQLTKLKHLQLSFYGPERGSGDAHVPSQLLPPNIFSELQALEALSIVVHPEDQRWVKIAKDMVQHIGSYKMLNYLQFYFPTMEALESFIEASPSWKDGRLKRFKFVVGHDIKRLISRVANEVELKYDQHDQCLRFLNGDHQVPDVVKRVLHKPVTAFYLDNHLEVQTLSEFGISNLRELKFCVVRECPKFQAMMMSERSESAFPNLEHLGMHYLWEMERIWDVDTVPSGSSFKALKYLRVDTCPKLHYIASKSVLQCLSNLETLIVEDCEALKSVVGETESVTKCDETLLPQLTQLVLRHLPELVTLGTGLCPPTEIITTHFCPKLIATTPQITKVKRGKWLGLV